MITIGAARCARWIATSLATSSAFEPPSPTAHTRINGSVERSMCFLSSAMSHEIELVTELRELDPQLVGGDLVETVADHRPVAARRNVTVRDGGDRLPLREHVVHRVGERRAGRRAARADRVGVEVAELVGDARARGGSPRRSARRTPWSTGPPSRRRGRRTCRARRRPCRRGRCCGGSRSRAPRRSGRARGRRCGWCRWWCRSG